MADRTERTDREKKTKTRKDRILEIAGAAIDLALFVLVFLPWTRESGSAESIIQYGLHVIAGDTGYSALSGIMSIAPLAGGAAGLYKGIELLRGKGLTPRLIRVTHFMCGCAVLYMAYFFAFYISCTFIGYAWPFLTILDFLLNKYALEYKDLAVKNRELDRKHHEDEEEKKRRLAFAGRYSSGIYRIQRKVARAYRKEYILLTFCGALSSAFLCTALGLREMFMSVHTTEEILIGGGLEEILKNTVITAIILNVLLMAFAYGVYGAKRRRTVRTLRALGARSRLLAADEVLEYAVSSLISVAIGCAAGTVAALAIGAWAKDAAGVAAGRFSPVIYLETLGFYAVLTFFSLMVNYQVAVWQTSSERAAVKKERIPWKVEALVAVAAGAVLAAAEVFMFHRELSSEDLKYQFLFISGAGLVIYGAAAIIAIGTRRGGTLNKVSRSSLMYHFMTTVLTVMLLTGIQFAILGPFAAEFGGEKTAEDPSDLFPYDYVMMGRSSDAGDQEDVAALRDLGAAVKEFPMIRVTTAHGAPYSWADVLSNAYMDVMWPQGQQVMIPESEYYKLKEMASGDRRQHRGYTTNTFNERLDLKGDEIHVVFQQDSSRSSHPLEWFMEYGDPNFRIGQPLNDYNWHARDRYFPPHKIKSREYAILTGEFGRGRQENIIVVSDRYFSKLRQGRTEGPDVMYLVNTGKVKGSGAVDKIVSCFSRRHRGDSRWDSEIRPVYARDSMISDVTTERIMKDEVTVMTLIILCISSVLITFLRFVTQEQEMTKKYRLLFYLGMTKKQESRFIRQELRPYFLPPAAVALGSALLFQGMIFSQRQFTADQMKVFTGGTLEVWLVFAVVQVILWAVLRKRLKKCVRER